MGANRKAIERQERQDAMEEEYPRLWKEVERLRERAERAERERDVLVEACLTRYSNDRWGVTVGNYAVGTFDSRDAAIRGMLEFTGLDAAPAGAVRPAERPGVDVYSRPECIFNYCPYPENCQAKDGCEHSVRGAPTP